MNRSALARLLALGAVLLVSAFGCRSLDVPRFAHSKHPEVQFYDKVDGGKKTLNCKNCHENLLQKPAAKGLPEPATCSGNGRPWEGSCHGPGARQQAEGAPAPFIVEGTRNGRPYRVEWPSPPAPETLASRDIVFTHKSHLGRKGIQAVGCPKCHGFPKGAPSPTYPGMPECLQCHDQAFATGDCRRCHQAGDLTRLRPQSFLRHDIAFLRDHGIQATRNQRVCTQCHAQTWCNDCHDPSQTISVEARNPDAIQREFVHRGDFVTRHTIEARSAIATCQRCHQPSFCDSCHVQRGVAGNAVGSHNPHPAGWVGHDTSNPNFHGRAAKRDIVTCAACHDQGPATNCILCHRVGGSGGNPHPSGWSSSRSPQSAMCRYCHGG
jgi:hypothetical protein